MAIVKQSFLSNIIGRNTYDDFKDYAKRIVIIGTCVLVIVLPFSFFFHTEFINYLLNLAIGGSLFFIAYIAALVLLLDIEVDVNEPEKDYRSKQEKEPKPIAYKLTIIWDIVLIILGLCAIYFSNEYKTHYAFDCDTFLVDHQARVYHLEWCDDCEIIAEADELEELKGYQIDKSYTLCEWCEEEAQALEEEYGHSKYYRR